jgi:hypothetical protein
MEAWQFGIIAIAGQLLGLLFVVVIVLVLAAKFWEPHG